MRIGRLALVLGALGTAGCKDEAVFPSTAELEQLESIRFVRAAVTTDKTNPLFSLTDRSAAEQLGDALFHDRALSSCNQVACADCHQAPSYADPGKAFSVGCNEQQGLRNAPSLLNARYGRFYFWDGRADSLWSQATGPLTDGREMAATPAHIQSVLQARYAEPYRALFGKAPEAAPAEEVLLNVGRSIQVYLWEEKFVAANAPFDTALHDFVEKAKDAIFAEEAGDPARAEALQQELEAMPMFLGLKTFVRKGQCIACHKGGMLSDDSFHNVGVEQLPLKGEGWDHGLVQGFPKLLANPFRANGSYSADTVQGETRLAALRELVDTPEAEGAFKTPSLRNVTLSAPYMHDGSLRTLEEVIEFYNRGGGPVGTYPGSRAKSVRALQLADDEKAALLDLLKSLTDPSLEN